MSEQWLEPGGTLDLGAEGAFQGDLCGREHLLAQNGDVLKAIVHVRIQDKDA